MSFKVYKTPCQNCLLSKDAIVSPKRRREIIQSCATEQTHFICHKSSMEGGNVCCRTFYDQMGNVTQMIRIAQRLRAVEFVDLPDGEKLPTYKEMKS